MRHKGLKLRVSWIEKGNEGEVDEFCAYNPIEPFVAKCVNRVMKMSSDVC